MVYLWKGTVGCVVLKGQLVRREGIEPNAIVYNPIIDALGESQRFKEAMRMLEQPHYLNIQFFGCKAGDLAVASKILKTMIGRGFVPTRTTYNYFFRYFSKHVMIEEGMTFIPR
ncbi:pentatricopeptide repeat-containing protein [Quercus suber]|uniref:Pentatricopeptide repeat-containing protein n=1 Tax=Quercus suber TaxID=58331 RepID=A0AAW0L4J9_QUESU